MEPLLGVGSCQYWTKMEVTEIDKHTSLLQSGINYGKKKFYSTGPQWQYHKLFMTMA
jgi:hypothetical protein